MTYNDLCAEVMALGFEDSIDKREDFLFSARRALGLLLTERPLYKSISFYQNPLTPCQIHADITHDGGAPVRISFSAKSYSFKTAGVGSYIIVDAEGERRFEFGCDECEHRGFLHGDGYIEFSGGYFYSVYSIAFFDKILGPSVTLIPTLSDTQEYDATKLVDDFFAFAAMPRGVGDAPIAGAHVYGNRLTLPSSYTGRVTVDYKACAQKLTGDGEEELMLPGGTEHLIGLLVAAYVWLDEDADKAQYYMSLYKDALSALRFYDRSVINNDYHETLGWA